MFSADKVISAAYHNTKSWKNLRPIATTMATIHNTPISQLWQLRRVLKAGQDRRQMLVIEANISCNNLTILCPVCRLRSLPGSGSIERNLSGSLIITAVQTLSDSAKPATAIYCCRYSSMQSNTEAVRQFSTVTLLSLLFTHCFSFKCKMYLTDSFLLEGLRMCLSKRPTGGWHIHNGAWTQWDSLFLIIYLSPFTFYLQGSRSLSQR